MLNTQAAFVIVVASGSFTVLPKPVGVTDCAPLEAEVSVTFPEAVAPPEPDTVSVDQLGAAPEPPDVST